jgi:trimeric autotransporter adhesin
MTIMQVIDVDSHVSVATGLEGTPFRVEVLGDGGHSIEFNRSALKFAAPNDRFLRPDKEPISARPNTGGIKVMTTSILTWVNRKISFPLAMLLVIALCSGGRAAAQTNASYGTDALESNTTGYEDSAFGAFALLSNTTGDDNTATGYSALGSNQSGSFNTAYGDLALANANGSDNTATGTTALYSNTSGGGNTATGFDSLYSNVSGGVNTADGEGALDGNTTGSANTSVGEAALLNNSSGDDNVAIGINALTDNNGSYNTASGSEALDGNTAGNYNTATGYQALYGSNFNTGSYNTANGWDTLYYNTTGYDSLADGARALFSNGEGSKNTAVGVDAMVDNTNGSYNIALGYQAGASLTTGKNNVDIGNAGVAGESNTIRVGTQGTQTITYLAGVSGTPVTGAEVAVSSTGQLGVVASSARFKRDVRAMGPSSDGLMKLRPVTFRYKNDPKGIKQYGLIAEQVQQIYPELVTYDAQGQIESVRYQELIPMLLNQVQQQHNQLQQQKDQFQRVLLKLRADNQTLRSALYQVQDQVAHIAAQMPDLAQR